LIIFEKKYAIKEAYIIREHEKSPSTERILSCGTIIKKFIMKNKTYFIALTAAASHAFGRGYSEWREE
jgi:hypothetical protein